MNCARCGSKLQPFNFLEDVAETHHYYSKAKLVGFTNPNGWVCTNGKMCRLTYGQNEAGEVHLVLEINARYDFREDLGEAGGVWEIIEQWFMG